MYQCFCPFLNCLERLRLFPLGNVGYSPSQAGRAVSYCILTLRSLTVLLKLPALRSGNTKVRW